MITVIGSLNMDLVVTADRAPEEGETVTGSGFAQYPGGKGANQAVAAARSGAITVMAGRVGRDSFGDALISSLARDPIDTSSIEKISGVPTGTAAITVDRRGQNRIVVVPGANGTYTAEDMEHLRPLIARSNVLLLQLEIPVEAVERAVVIAREENVYCMVNPAPAADLSRSFYRQVDLLTPNESELGLLAGMPTEVPAAWRTAGHRLLDLGLQTLLVTLGVDGSLAMDSQSELHLPAYKVKMLDSTAAGDCFNGALAAGIDALVEARGRTRDRLVLTPGDLAPMIDRATRAAAMSVTRQGAQPSIPWREEVDGFDSWYPQHRS